MTLIEKVVEKEDGLEIKIEHEAWVAKTKIPIHISYQDSCITFRTANGKNPLRIKDIADLGV